MAIEVIEWGTTECPWPCTRYMRYNFAAMYSMRYNLVFVAMHSMRYKQVFVAMYSQTNKKAYQHIRYYVVFSKFWKKRCLKWICRGLHLQLFCCHTWSFPCCNYYIIEILLRLPLSIFIRKQASKKNQWTLQEVIFFSKLKTTIFLTLIMTKKNYIGFKFCRLPVCFKKNQVLHEKNKLIHFFFFAWIWNCVSIDTFESFVDKN